MKEQHQTVERKQRSKRQRGVFKRGDTWYVRFKYNGKDVKKSVGKDYQDAVNAYHENKLSIANATYEERYGRKSRLAKTSMPTLGEFADRFLKEYCDAPGKKKSLREFHEFGLKKLRSSFCDTPMDKITPWQVRKFQAELAKMNGHGGKPLTPATINRRMATLRKVLSYAVACDVIKESPFRGVETLRENNKRESYLTPDECQRLVDAADERIKTVLLCAIHTGMRRGEILDLTWDRVDLVNRIIRLDEGKTVVSEPEYVPIDGTLFGILSTLPRRSRWVFTGGRFNLEKMKDVRRGFERAVKKSGIAEERRRTGKLPLRFHDLRHTTASLMVMESVPLEAVQKMLRHRNIQTTQRYAHLSPGYMQNAVSILDRTLQTGTNSGTFGTVVPIHGRQ